MRLSRSFAGLVETAKLDIDAAEFGTVSSERDPRFGVDYHRRKTCRACGSRKVRTFLDLGRMPLAGDFLLESEVGRERSFPLRISLCHNCTLVQVLDVVSPKVLFGEYRYLSSVTSTLRAHFERYAADLARELHKTQGPFVVEIGCNDGVLLKPLQDHGFRALGVEPAENVAEVARSRGLDVLNGFFDEALAARIRAEHGPATAVLANNVFAHIDDLERVVKGIVRLLEPGGIFVFEVHYLRELLRLMQYDFFYHEHLCYYTLSALVPFLGRHGLRVFDVRSIPIHGGSIRVHARKSDTRVRPSRKLVAALSRERQERLGAPSTYEAFARRVAAHAVTLRKTLQRLRSEGKSVAGYGAPGRGNTLLCHAKIDRGLLPYIVDASPSRYGRFTPGTHIPILPVEEFHKAPPDVALMLAWSYQREILSTEAEFLRSGRRFLVPLPRLRFVRSRPTGGTQFSSV